MTFSVVYQLMPTKNTEISPNFLLLRKMSFPQNFNTRKLGEYIIFVEYLL